MISWVPLSDAALIMIDIVHSRGTQDEVLHLCHPRPVSWTSMMETFAKELNLRVVPFSEWVSLLEKRRSETKNEAQKLPALKLLSFFQQIAKNEKFKYGERQNEALVSARMGTDNLCRISPRVTALASLSESDFRSWPSFSSLKSFDSYSDTTSY